MTCLHVTQQGSTAVLTLDDNATRNAMGTGMRAAFSHEIRRLRSDDTIRALVITGTNGQFCAGGDLRDIACAGLDGAGWRNRLHAMHDWLRELLCLDKPVICAIDGAAFGAGMGLALAGDFILATPRLRMCASFLRIGLVPDFGLFYTLPRIVGAQRARELMLSAREIGAEEALHLGLAMEIHPPEALLDRALALANSFHGASPTAVGLIKRATAAPDNLLRHLDLEANAQALAMGTREHQEALQDFLAKRPARFAWPQP